MTPVMKRALIVGAGGFGRELFSYCLQHPDNGAVWRVGGFLDDDSAALKDRNYPVGVVAKISDYKPDTNDVLICGIGSPVSKRKICESLCARGAIFMSFIHPRAVIGHNVSVGSGVVLCPDVRFTCDAIIGNFTTFNCASGAAHDCSVGAYTTISGGCEMAGGVSIGEEVLVGSHATLMPKIRIGNRAIIGPGSVVVRHVAAGETVFGNPARTLVRPSS